MSGHAMFSFGRIRVAWLLAASVLVLAAAGCGAGTPPAVRGGESGGATFILPLASDAATSLASGLRLAVSIAGGADKTVEVDTGSRGVVVARSAIGPQATDTGRSGRVEYTSDGLILSGEYFLATIGFHTAQSTVATIPVRVLGVESSSCDSKYPRCRPDADTEHVGMLGVGYGTYAKSGKPPAAEVDPFLELQAMQDGTARRGYIITRNSVTLGLTAADPTSFDQVTLARPTGSAGLPSDWGAAPGCFALPDYGNDERCGTILVDTGIATMIVGPGPAGRPPALRTAIPNGTRIRIGLPAFSDPALTYTMTTGATNDSLAPQGDPAARWSRSGPFVNTGRHLLAGYDYLFDADTGHIGFRKDPA
ncbi:hypothetical protein [Nocardia sp. GAS34]|uniref:hypothetical protein n=1 Tax=unclassified Nocardia TaxID=2637762 RepID=UPI003D22D7C5